MIKSYKHFFPRDLMMGKLRIHKEKSIIKLYEQGKSSREICQEEHISFRELGRIIRKYDGEKDSKVVSNQTKAYSMFLAGKPIISVAIHLGLGSEEVKQYYYEYLSIYEMDNFVKITKDHGYFLPFLSKVAEKMKSNEFESDVDNLIYCMNDVKTVIRVRDKVQHEVNMLTIKRDDLLKSGQPE
ncbi:hypothetical protein [Candidatus Nitrosocosmicus oleophilus]|nr:hypothetical protein [Candidatus Nitrosocosmicus oleophilus]